MGKLSAGTGPESTDQKSIPCRGGKKRSRRIKKEPSTGGYIPKLVDDQKQEAVAPKKRKRR